MNQRERVTAFLAGLAVVMMIVSYLFLSAPWGYPPDSESYSNPKVAFAPLLFLLGVILLFVAPVVYELLPDEEQTD